MACRADAEPGGPGGMGGLGGTHQGPGQAQVGFGAGIGAAPGFCQADLRGKNQGPTGAPGIFWGRVGDVPKWPWGTRPAAGNPEVNRAATCAIPETCKTAFSPQRTRHSNGLIFARFLASVSPSTSEPAPTMPNSYFHRRRAANAHSHNFSASRGPGVA